MRSLFLSVYLCVSLRVHEINVFHHQQFYCDNHNDACRIFAILIVSSQLLSTLKLDEIVVTHFAYFCDTQCIPRLSFLNWLSLQTAR